MLPICNEMVIPSYLFTIGEITGLPSLSNNGVIPPVYYFALLIIP